MNHCGCETIYATVIYGFGGSERDKVQWYEPLNDSDYSCWFALAGESMPQLYNNGN